MGKYIKLLAICSLICSFATVSQATVTFMLGPSFNNFSDSRVSGIGSTFTMMFDMEKLDVGYKIEQQNLTISDAQSSSVNFMTSNQITALVAQKDIAHISDELPIDIGLELGSMNITGLTGTIAAPAAISQVIPEVGINGGIKYDNSGKSINTALYLNIGYRFANIKNIPSAATGFTAGGASLKDLSALRIEIGAAIGF